MNVRIQTYGEGLVPFKQPDADAILEGTTAIQALQKGLKDLQELCDVVVDKFWTAREDFAHTAAS
jgi:hypothetical protein